jgi:hypothetical protein
MYTAATALAACSTSTTDNKPDEQISVSYGVGTVRAECLDWLLVVGRGHLEGTLKVPIAHYNAHHPHRAPFCEDAECLRWLRYPAPPTGVAAWPTATVRVDAGQVWWVRGPAHL